MSKITVLNVKIDSDLKKLTQEAAAALGLPVSTVVAAGLREFVRTRTIIFTDPPHLKPEVEAELLKISENAKKGSDISPVFDNAKDAVTWLKAEVKKENQ